MQKFPKDSRDVNEKKYAKFVLKFFPSYKLFWEKFIGINTSNNVSLLPRIPSYPFGYKLRKKRSFERFQRWLGNVNYSIFNNLVAANNHHDKYLKTLPLTNKRCLFWPMEHYESAYLHIGNIIFELRELYDSLKERNIIQKSINGKYLSDFLGVNSSNWDQLNDEPREFRNCLVHNFRYIYTIAEEFYFPNKTDSSKIMWQDMDFDYFIPGSKKLKNHIDLSFKSCDDIYKKIIPIIESYTYDEGIII